MAAMVKEETVDGLRKRLKRVLRNIARAYDNSFGGTIPFDGGFVFFDPPVVDVYMNARVGDWQFETHVAQYNDKKGTMHLGVIEPPDELQDALAEVFETPRTFSLNGAEFEVLNYEPKPLLCCLVQTPFGGVICRFRLWGKWFIEPSIPFLRGLCEELERILEK